MNLVLLLIATVYSIPEDLWFQKDDSPTFIAKMVLGKEENVDTELSCQMACAGDDKCTAISYSHSTCILLADQDDGAMCSRPLEVLTKKTRAEVRRNPTEFAAELGTDPCVIQVYAEQTRMDSDIGICPRDENNFAIRGVNEAGGRITFDNNAKNVLTFDVDRNIWKLYYPDTGFERFLVAVSCVTTKNSPVRTCGCAARPPMMYATRDYPKGEAAQISVPGPCPYESQKMTFWGGKFAAGQSPVTVAEEDVADYQVTCKAGIWLLTNLDDGDVSQVTNVTCW